MAPSQQYSSAQAAAAFAAFSAAAGGEKALLWSWLRQRMALAGAPRVLDFGCGSGWLARQAAVEFGARATGYDPSPSMIAEAAKTGEARFTTSLDEARNAGPYDRAFAVFVTPALETGKALKAMFANIAGCLAADGMLAVAAANPGAVFARHAFFESRRPEKLAQGARYETDILGPAGETLLTVTDHYWPAAAIEKAAQAARLRVVADTLIADPQSRGSSAKFPYRIWDFARAV